MSAADAQLLARFVSAFSRAIEREVAAMRASSETREVELLRGEELGGKRYGFELAEPNDRLAAGGEGSLRTARGEARVTVERCADLRIILSSDQAVDVSAAPISLVVAPWFLYQRLIQALADLALDRHSVGTALTLFGKRPHRRAPVAVRCAHEGLNASQHAAVQLCTESELAFIWGPPGTGKTVTLAHVVEELLAHDRRILLASTTNAAIDQVLAKMAGRPWFAAATEAGSIVRLGRSEEATFGAELPDVVARLQANEQGALDRLRARVAAVEQQLRYGEGLRAELAAAAAPQQSLFADPPARLRAAALARIFPEALADAVARRPIAGQAAAVDRRLARLERLRTLARKRVAELAAALRDMESRVLGDARVVLCTLTNAYLSPLMRSERFDVLIAEEAGMAALPSLFYAACLCREKAIMVGDPRQLPPIVQSREELVQRAIGRNVFDVTIPDASRSEVVTMLDVQYRMHAVIGGLVGRLFYHGRLVHGGDATRSAAIASRAPYPGAPLVVVDTAGRTTCQRSTSGSSRVNPISAEVTAGLAFEAVAGGAGSVAVITPYAAQAREIRRRLAVRRTGDAVECSTIHRFQGRECDVVLIDLVDAPPLHPGVLLSGRGPAADAAHLLNVSLSRARGKLILIADVAYFDHHAPDGVVSAILREASREGVLSSPAYSLRRPKTAGP